MWPEGFPPASFLRILLFAARKIPSLGFDSVGMIWIFGSLTLRLYTGAIFCAQTMFGSYTNGSRNLIAMLSDEKRTIREPNRLTLYSKHNAVS